MPHPPAGPDAPQPATQTTEDLKKLVGTLQDDQQRAQLVKQLQALIAAQQQGAAAPEPAEPADLISEATARLQQFGDELASTAAVMVDVPVLIDWIEQELADPQARGRWIGVGKHVGEILGAAIVVNLLLGLIARRLRRPLARPRSASWTVQLTRLLGLMLVDLLPIIGFVVHRLYLMMSSCCRRG